MSGAGASGARHGGVQKARRQPVQQGAGCAEGYADRAGDVRERVGTIDGMGEKAAEAVEEAAKAGPFLSKDDFRSRTKVSKTVIDLMADLGLLGDIPESNQISLFDLVG